MLKFRGIFLVLILALFSACQPSLEHQPKIRTLEEPRTPPLGTVPYSPISEVKSKLNRELILRGKERYQIYCGVCHGLTGAGDGIATTRGYGAPLPFSENPSVDAIEKIIANGQGRMMGFANRIPYPDRSAIAVYVDVLRMRAHFPSSRLDTHDLENFKGDEK
jgi:mono/diheme cytochrome c family protein